jgi:hypothetical protein
MYKTVKRQKVARPGRIFLIARIEKRRRRRRDGISHLVPVIKFYVSILLCISSAAAAGCAADDLLSGECLSISPFGPSGMDQPRGRN